jgi:hypothetical protein
MVAIMDIYNTTNSQECVDSFGRADIVDLCSIDKFSRDEIFISIVECYIVSRIRKGEVHRWISEILQSNSYGPRDLLDNNGQFLINASGRVFNSIVKLYSFLNNKSRIDSAVVLGASVGIKYDSVFGFRNKDLYYDGVETSSHRDYLFENNVPHSIKIREDTYSLCMTIYIRNIASDVIGGIVVYKFGEDCILLPAHVEEVKTEHPRPRYYLCIGRRARALRLINEDLIEMNTASLIVFFDNPIVADLFQKKVHDSYLVFDKDVVGTSFFGGYSEIDSVNFSCLCGHDIILVPSESKESYLNMLDYAKKIEISGAKSVLICNEPYVLHEASASNALRNSKFGKYVEQNTVNFLLKEIFLLVNRLKKLSFTPNNYLLWCIKYELINGAECKVDNSCLMNASEFIELYSADDCEQVNLFDNLISLDNFTLIYGPSNAGKGMLLLTMLHSIAYKIKSFRFEVKKPRKVMLIDGETGVKRLRERFYQLSKAYPYEDIYKNNLWFISLRDTDIFSEDFFNEGNRKFLINLLKEHGISVVALDNLFSICHESSISDKTVSRIIDFAKEMASIGVATIFSHHTNKEGEMHGSRKLHNLMQNIIKIEGKESIDTGIFKDIDDKFLAFQGALISIKYEKCKEYIELENSKSVFFLNKPTINSEPSRWIDLIGDYDGKDENILGKHRENDEDVKNIVEHGASDGDQSSLSNINDLTGEERNIYEFIKSKIKTKKKEIVEFSGFKEHRITEILSILIERNLIYKEGNTSDTCYILNHP